jgi:hypothetical protein
MKIPALRHGTATDIEVVIWPHEDLVPSAGDECTVGENWTDGQGYVGFRNKPLRAQTLDQAAESRLRAVLARGFRTLAWLPLLEPQQDSMRGVLRVVEFRAQHVWPSPLDIAVDERIVADVAGRYVPDGATPATVADWLTDQCLLPHPERSGIVRAFMSAGGADRERTVPAFRLHGLHASADVLADASGRFRVTRVVEERLRASRDNKRAKELLEGTIRFVDATAATVARREAVRELRVVIEHHDSFLAMWRDYNEIDRRLAESRRNEVGDVAYIECKEIASNVWRFRLSDSGRSKASGLAELVDELGETVLEAANNGTESKTAFTGVIARFGTTGRYIAIKRFRGNAATPPAEGVLRVSARGDETRLKRREDALQWIVSGSSQMPQLGLFLEGRPAPTASYRRLKPWSPAAIQALGGSPTPQQTLAMDVALNTPDIALIQGPPGTGKTRLIAALQVRIDEEFSQSTEASRRLLLTSFQHDAVEHAASATTVRGLPAVKVGGKRGESASADSVERWRLELLGKLDARLAAMGGAPGRTLASRLRHLQLSYATSPGSSQHAAALLAHVADLTNEWISAPLRRRIEDRIEQLRRPVRDNSTDLVALIKAVRRLRVTTASYEDDGQLMARALTQHREAHSRFGATQMAILAALAGDAPPDFAEQQSLREQLLDTLLNPTSPPHGMADPGVEFLLAAAIEEIHARASLDEDTDRDVLAAFVDILQNETEAVRLAVQGYATVLAATCQQTAGPLQRLLRESRGDSGRTSFDTVVVDEAARANPLDLLIPLAMATRRVVLVGDHRQLPHVLEPEVERELSRQAHESAGLSLDTSMFELLFTERLPMQTQLDGARRVVTLDTQYRMHPTLGSLISKTFYEPHGEVALRAGLPAESFKHGLAPFGDRVAAWLDVRRRIAADDELPGLSKQRPVEAKAVALALRRLVEQSSAARLTFGIIAFYRAQVDAIWRALEEEGLAERTAASGYRVVPSRLGVELGPRVRIGTVDAFQGREFDITILSMTRANDHADTTQGGARRRFGYLTLANRLCVAMSRQKRLLIVAGALDMLSSPGAAESVPGLCAFRDLCRGSEGGIYDRF